MLETCINLRLFETKGIIIEMADISITAFIAPLLRMVPYVKRLQAEKTAGENPFPVQSGRHKIDELLDDAIRRLGNISNEDVFWRQVLTFFENKYVSPDLFKVKAVQEWLADDSVRIDLRDLARSRRIGQIDNSDVIQRLQNSLIERTGDNRKICNNVLEITLAVMQASCFSVLSLGEQVIDASIKDIAQETRSGFGALSEKIDARLNFSKEPNTGPDPVHTEELKRTLDRLVRLRSIPGTEVPTDIRNLIKRIENGDLTHASMDQKLQTYYWAARIVGPHDGGLEDFDRYSNKYLDNPERDPIKSAFLKAERLRITHEFPAAAAAFSEIDMPDARTMQMHLIHQENGTEAALEWIESHQQAPDNLLNEVGLKNVLIMLAEKNRWEDAVTVAAETDVVTKRMHPDLLFVEGVLNAAMLLPEPERLKLLQGSDEGLHLEYVEGFKADEHRATAIAVMNEGYDLLTRIGATKRALACQRHLMWIRLQSEDHKDAAIKDLLALLANEQSALEFLPIALEFGISFDLAKIKLLLKRRKLAGLDNTYDRYCEFRITLSEASTEELLKFIDENADRLRDILVDTSIIALRVECLAKLDRYQDAHELISKHQGHLPNADIEMMRHVLANYEGKPLTLSVKSPELELSYQRLKMTAQTLAKSQQWSALLPYARRLFALRRSVETLSELVRVLQLTLSDPTEIVSILEDNIDLLQANTPQVRQLVLAQGWSHYQLGNVAQAIKIAVGLVGTDAEPGATTLQIQAGLRLGKWEAFPVIADRVLKDLKLFPKDLIFNLANLIADSDRHRAFELIGHTAEMYPDDANVQASSYFLASQLKLEDEASGWLQRALALSENTEDGPMKAISLTELVDMAPKHHERQRELQRQYSSAEIPIHAFSELVGVTIAEILLASPNRNEKERDPRKRSFVPIRHGALPKVGLERSQVFSCDYTSILLLQYLGFLDNFISFAGTIFISPKFMDLLFMERRKIQFHQPSRVEEARVICALVSEGKLKCLSANDFDDSLTSEVGDEMASLFNAAAITGGKVVAAQPIPKAGSLLELHANIGEHSRHLVGTRTILKLLENVLSPDVYVKADQYLASVDRAEMKPTLNIVKKPIYIDDLALKYFYISGLIDEVCNFSNDLYISKLTYDRARDLVSVAQNSSDLADQLDNIRLSIRKGLDSETIKLLRESHDAKEGGEYLRINALKDVVSCENVEVDTILVDDRSFVSLPKFQINDEREVVVAGILDLIRELEKRTYISKSNYQSALFRLRVGGFGLLPIEANELFDELKNVELVNGLLKETSTLRSIRENLLRVRSIKVVRLPEEAIWFNELRIVSLETIERIWQDESIEANNARAISNWIFDVILPSAANWGGAVIMTAPDDVSTFTKLMLAQLVSIGFQVSNSKRRKQYSAWVQAEVLSQVLHHNTLLIEELAGLFAKQTQALAKELHDDVD
jgi:hypothetical protein